MKQLLDKEHIFIAQPPLYRVKRGKAEQYINTEQEMKTFLLNQGMEGLELTACADGKAFTPKKTKDLLELLVKLEKLSHAIERRGVKFGEYLESKQEKTKKLPLYRIKTAGEETYLYSDEEIAAYKGSGDAEKEIEMEGDSAAKSREKNTIIVQEFYEARELEKMSNEMEKYDVDISDYAKKPVEKKDEGSKKIKKQVKPIFVLADGKEILSLSELLSHVLKEGEKGLAIQRYKGLGEMNPDQLWETTMDPERRTLQKVTIEDVVKADEMFTVLMGDNVESRREFIMKHARDVTNLDV